jgi:putative hydrolase of the HAD superfamily
MRKPELKIYRLTLKKLKVKPEECIFIDDKEKNLKPAKKLGIKTVLAKNPKQVIRDVCKILRIKT